MSDIIAFLTARLDEDEAIARACGVDPNTDDAPISWTYGPSLDPEVLQLLADNPPDGMLCRSGQSGRGAAIIITHWEEDGEHIARHDPARVLAEVAAKRAIVKACVDYQDIAAEDVLWALASVYSDHEDYSEEWKP